MLNIGRYRLRASSCPDIYRNSMTTIAEEKDEVSSGLITDEICWIDLNKLQSVLIIFLWGYVFELKFQAIRRLF